MANNKKQQNKAANRVSKNSMSAEEIVKAFDAREDREQIVAWKKAYSKEYTEQSQGNGVGKPPTIAGELIMFASLFLLGFGYVDRVWAMVGFAVGLVLFGFGVVRNNKERQKFKEGDVRKAVIDKLGYTLTKEQQDAFKKRQEARRVMIQEKRDYLQEQAQDKKLSARFKKLFGKEDKSGVDVDLLD